MKSTIAVITIVLLSILSLVTIFLSMQMQSNVEETPVSTYKLRAAEITYSRKIQIIPKSVSVPTPTPTSIMDELKQDPEIIQNEDGTIKDDSFAEDYYESNGEASPTATITEYFEDTLEPTITEISTVFDPINEELNEELIDVTQESTSTPTAVTSLPKSGNIQLPAILFISALITVLIAFAM